MFHSFAPFKVFTKLCLEFHILLLFLFWNPSWHFFFTVKSNNFYAMIFLQAATLRFQKEKEDIEKNRSVKLKKKKEAMTLRLQKEQQEVTAKLVEKHSKQMLDLLKQEQEKLKQELEEELVRMETMVYKI